MNAEKILKKVESLSSGKENDIITLKELDALGLIIAPDEDLDTYKERIRNLMTTISDFDNEIAEKRHLNLFDYVKLDEERRITPEIMDEASEINKKFYSFKIDWVPGFFMLKSLGFLWGGCAITFPENNLSLFLIRSNFAKKRKWLFYKRDELLAHELCHIARGPVKDFVYEEFFAYKISPSSLRRYLGNCFRFSCDAIFFIIPFFLLLAAQIVQTFTSFHQFPVYPFWIVIGIYPLFLLLRNQIARNYYFRAEANLQKAGIPTALQVLFRCSKTEIQTIAAFSKDILALKEWLAKQANTHLRWQVIYERFMSEEGITELYPNFDF